MSNFLSPMILSILTVFTCLHVQASESCETVNVLDKYADESEKSKKMLEFFSKPRNQDSWGACYAFTAADMVSFELNAPVSALHMTAKYEKIKEKRGEPFDGGDPAEAIKLAESGICSEEEFPNFTNVSVYRGKELVKLRETIDTLKTFLKQGQQQDLCQTLRTDLKLNLKNMSFVDIVRVLANNSDKSSVEVLNQFASKNCQHVLNLPTVQFVKSDAEPIYEYRNGEKIQVFGSPIEKDKAINTLDEGLSKGKPVAIGYKPVEMLNLESDDPNVGHASTVLGRKLVNGKCMYIVRNSWGNSPCGNRQVPAGIVCGTKEGQEIPYGTYMVSRETLHKYIDDSFYTK